MIIIKDLKDLKNFQEDILPNFILKDSPYRLIHKIIVSHANDAEFEHSFWLDPALKEDQMKKLYHILPAISPREEKVTLFSAMVNRNIATAGNVTDFFDQSTPLDFMSIMYDLVEKVKTEKKDLILVT